MMMGVQQQEVTAAVTAITAAIDPSIQQRKALCEECKVNPSKYKCPGCSARTCCLSCVNSHKQRTSCTGKRDQTQFVPLSQFNDNILLSDYNLLEGVKRVAESAQRRRLRLCGHYPQFSLSSTLKSLRGAAARRDIKLLFLPKGMLKREKNKTRYDHRKKSISWTIEWRFHSTDVVLLDHGIREDTTLRCAIGKHLEPSPWKNKLREFCDTQLGNLKLFIRKYPRGPRSPFRELDINAPVSQQLAQLAIVEYPVIHVFLRSHTYDFEVVKDLKPLPDKRNLKQSTEDNCPGQEGVLFKEEEIEDDGSGPDTQVLDLLMSSGPDAEPPNCHQVQKTVQELNNMPSDKIETAHPADEDLNMCFNEPGVLGAEDEFFDFDPDLMDVYSYLMEENNPDDLLDFNWDGVDNSGHSNEILPANEDLEEGEIRDST